MFLRPNTVVVPTEHHDYGDWHQGRQNYALWYLEIEQTNVLDYLEHLRLQFSDILFQPNTRQFHITLFICGFYTEETPLFNDDFSKTQFEVQIKHLIDAHIKTFTIKTTKLNSFESALFIEIEDHHQILSKIRLILSQQAIEIAPLDYCPHITLGLYKDAIQSNDVFERIANIQQTDFEIDINHLTFGCYQAQHLQGSLQAFYQHTLGSA